jgi:hypothetical protein
MASTYPRNHVVRTETLWYIIGAFFLIVGTIGSLGEWVFHWWNDPWEWAGPTSLGIGLFAVMWGASARDLRAFRPESRAFQTQMLDGQEKLLAGQAEQTTLLREVVASFRRQ